MRTPLLPRVSKITSDVMALLQNIARDDDAHNFIGAFEDLVNALYDGSPEIYTETEVTYEDGRKGEISATLEIRDAAVVPVTASKIAAE